MKILEYFDEEEYPDIYDISEMDREKLKAISYLKDLKTIEVIGEKEDDGLPSLAVKINGINHAQKEVHHPTTY